MTTVAKSFTYSGSEQSFQIPDGVTSVFAECWGAQGGPTTIFGGAAAGGLGAYAATTILVSPGETLFLFPGGQGGHTGSGDVYHLGGYNGGGNGKFMGGQVGTAFTFAGGGGGGATDIRQGGDASPLGNGGGSTASSGSDNRVLVAGGGGGGGCPGAANPNPAFYGGGGGAASAGVGFAGGQGFDDSWGGAGNGGGGGKITAPGDNKPAASGWPNPLANPNLPFPGTQSETGLSGDAAKGGDGGLGGYNGGGLSGGGGGGGGGGWFGGNGGNGGASGFTAGVFPAVPNGGGGGGGGSSHSIYPGASFADNANSGNGRITLTYQPAPYAPVTIAPIDGSVFDPTQALLVDWLYQPSEISGTTQHSYQLGKSTDGGVTWSYWNGSTFVGGSFFNTTASTQVTFPANTFSDGQSLQFQVWVTDSTYLGVSPVSSVLHMTASKVPVVTVTAPTGTVAVPRPPVTWTRVLGSGATQTTFQVRLFTQAQTLAAGFDPNVTTPKQDSGVITSAALTWTPTASLAPGTYVAYVQLGAKTTTGPTQLSTWGAGSVFTVSYAQPSAAGMTALVGAGP